MNFFGLFFVNIKREMSSEISGGTFDRTRPPDWPTQIRQLRVGQSGGLVHSNVPPEISLDISLSIRLEIAELDIACYS